MSKKDRSPQMQDQRNPSKNQMSQQPGQKSSPGGQHRQQQQQGGQSQQQGGFAGWEKAHKSDLDSGGTQQ
jgi:alanine dehydrogenase